MGFTLKLLLESLNEVYDVNGLDVGERKGLPSSMEFLINYLIEYILKVFN